MRAFRSSLITKIALLVICVEVVAFGVLGWFYIDRFSTAADEQARSRLQLVGRLIAGNELQINAIAQRGLMDDLLGADYLQGMVIGGNARVIVSTDPAYLGRSVREVPDFDPQWIAATAPDVQFIPGPDTLTCITRIGGPHGAPVYYTVTTISTAAITARKRSIAVRGWSASLAFILLSSVGIILFVHRFISRRVDGTLAVLKRVEGGAMDSRIPVSSPDELGQLQHGINSMIENIGRLLDRHRRNEEELGAILNSVREGLIAIDPHGRIMRFNANAQALVGTGLALAKERGLAEYLPELASAGQPPWESVLAEGKPLDNFRFKLPGPDGKQRFIEMACAPVRDADGASAGAVLALRDITERQAAEEQLRLAANVFTHSREGIVITDTDGTIVNVNKAFTQITGYERDEVIGKNPRILQSGRQGPEFYAAMWRSLIEQGYWGGEIWNRRKNGEIYPELLTISAVYDDQGKVQQYVGLFFDITVQKEQQKQLEYIAHYDALTHLPNRVLLADRLQQSMLQAQRRRQIIAVVYLDLDGFKAVNDNHGHDTGDRLLVSIAQRMKEALRKGDTIARLGGDEFVAVLVDLHNVHDVHPLLERLLSAVAQPVHIDGLALQVTASLGVTFYPQPEQVNADQLLRQADQAMYQAKLAGRNRYHLFDAEQDRSVRGHHESVENIRRALRNGEFTLYYQPQVNMRTGAVVGVEALIRWQHPEQGLLAPDSFLPIIQDHPLSIELGEWVLDTALTQLEAWRAEGLDISMSVNVGALQLQQSDFTERLRSLMAAHPTVRPGDLKLEVLETSALKDVEHVSQVMAACDHIGVSFALDDFGTGYSSLAYLKRLPASQLKIDRSFVRDMLDDPEDLAILEGVLSLATVFRREAIAEGVESQSQGEILLQLGCELAQGYGIARPMPADRIRGWIASWQPPESWVNQHPADRTDLPLLFAGMELRTWVRHIEECLKGQQTMPPSLDHRHCRFGRWLDSEGQALYGANSDFRRIESLHVQLHTLVAELLAIYSQGNHEQAAARLQELYELKDDLLGRLQALKLTQEQASSETARA